jgi:hypothetical protein
MPNSILSTTNPDKSLVNAFTSSQQIYQIPFSFGKKTPKEEITSAPSGTRYFTVGN